MTRLGPLALLPLIIVTAAACDNGSSTPVLAPASNSDTFTGIVPALPTHDGSDFHTFVVPKDGIVSVTLTTAGPPPTITMGLGVGTPTGSVCSIPSGTAVAAVASTTAQLGPAGLSAGTYCVEVFDVGNQAVDVTYTVIVAHP